MYSKSKEKSKIIIALGLIFMQNRYAHLIYNNIICRLLENLALLNRLKIPRVRDPEWRLVQC